METLEHLALYTFASQLQMNPTAIFHQLWRYILLRLDFFITCSTGNVARAWQSYTWPQSMWCTNLRKQIINRDHLKGENKIDELWPPNPNEFDRATFISHFSFCGPTSMLTS
jgi:hypothetical protein